ncbi:DUF2141 domain-containing protein [Plectonema cf. radiosum LEGE 06105]|uniref:DUF2141 domain-containing protein n=1 Tax=Plectonema cf. radiosum LEGE 06105 TaxID=945769 RepID=A0A8J7K3U4_9CYAN|nr:DUF2141 domain-containing protein [Plectonema radiosum]MBE9216121.1 DUF2141 domain-containing protein [Plectonema cf. radiosum LEGE 06105]
MKISQFGCLLFYTLASSGLFPKANAVEDFATLTVAINGIQNQKGQICLKIYENESGFPLGDNSGVKNQCTKITGNSIKQEFTNLKKGTYAVAVIDDQNDDTKLDRDFLGIPEEGFGISNNPTVSIKTGTPKFEQASFSLIQNQTIEIVMKYSLD